VLGELKVCGNAKTKRRRGENAFGKLNGGSIEKDKPFQGGAGDVWSGDGGGRQGVGHDTERKSNATMVGDGKY